MVSFNSPIRIRDMCWLGVVICGGGGWGHTEDLQLYIPPHIGLDGRISRFSRDYQLCSKTVPEFGDFLASYLKLSHNRYFLC